MARVTVIAGDAPRTVEWKAGRVKLEVGESVTVDRSGPTLGFVPKPLPPVAQVMQPIAGPVDPLSEETLAGVAKGEPLVVELLGGDSFDMRQLQPVASQARAGRHELIVILRDSGR